MQGNGAGVRKCLLFGLRNIISTVLSLLIEDEVAATVASAGFLMVAAAVQY